MRRIIVFAATAFFVAPLLAQNVRFEAENAQTLNGVIVRNQVPGYSGTGYVTDFTDSTDYFEMNVSVPSGLHELWVGYRSQFGQKGYRYRVGNEYGNGMFDMSTTFSADRAGLFNLAGGNTTLGIYKDWGYHDVDYLEFRPFTPPAVQPISAQLNDPLADRNTQLLMNYLTSIYGTKTLSGQQGEVGETDSFPTQDYLNISGGVIPAIRGSDFIFYSPSFLEHQDRRNGETERVRDWARQTGGAVSMMWHWNAPANLVNSAEYPWWRGFYTQGTTFDLAGALANPGGSDYQLILRDIDAIAVELQKFEDAGVPVIWRPLHEAQGNATDTTGNGAWFWWGADGPAALKQLWQLMYDRLTNYHGLHNLIWEFTSSAAQGNWLDWYPGDDYVDMIGLDIYTDPTSNMSGQWYDVLAQYNGRKMIALSESGTLPDPDLLDAFGIEWSYFSPWNWDYVKSRYADAGYSEAQIQSLLQELLNDDDIITLDELPLLPWSESAPIPGDYNDDGVVDAGDYVLWRAMMGQTGSGLAADSNLDGHVDAVDYQFWRSQFGQTAGSGSSSGNLPTVPEPAGILLGCLAASYILIVRRRTESAA